MAFAFTHNGFESAGSRRLAWGTYSNGAGDSGGDIITGLRVVQSFQLQPLGTAVVATEPKANETFPLNNTAVTIVTALDEDGLWFAIGV